MAGRRFSRFHATGLFAALLTVTVTSGIARAQTEEDTPLYGKSVWESSTFKEPEAWKEGELRLPEVPEDSALKRLALAVPDAAFEYYIAPDTLRLGKDGVVRYVVVLKSASGVANARYEGMWCANKQYKTYAYAVAGEFHPYPDPPWRRAHSAGGIEGYHGDLYRSYLCDRFGQPNSLPTIRQNLRGVNLGEDSGSDHGAGSFFGW